MADKEINKRIIDKIRHSLDEIEEEITDKDILDVSTAIGVKQIPSRHGNTVEWEPVFSQKTIIIKLNGGAVESRL